MRKGFKGFMNKVFKVVWSKSKECYVVVPEIAKNNNGKKKVLASVLAGLAVAGAMGGIAPQQAMAAVGGVILDGRDIGSVVLPKAELKIYLTASVDARAKRRWLEVQGTSNEQSLEDIKNNVESRDEMDKNRDESPLVCVEDAIVVDSSNMTFDETVEHILHLVQERI